MYGYHEQTDSVDTHSRCSTIVVHTLWSSTKPRFLVRKGYCAHDVPTPLIPLSEHVGHYIQSSPSAGDGGWRVNICPVDWPNDLAWYYCFQFWWPFRSDLDTSGDGKLSDTELERALTDLDINISPSQAHALVQFMGEREKKNKKMALSSW